MDSSHLPFTPSSVLEFTGANEQVQISIIFLFLHLESEMSAHYWIAVCSWCKSGAFVPEILAWGLFFFFKYQVNMYSLLILKNIMNGLKTHTCLASQSSSGSQKFNKLHTLFLDFILAKWMPTRCKLECLIWKLHLAYWYFFILACLMDTAFFLKL